MTTKRKPFIYFDLGNVLLFFDHKIACRNLAELCNVTSEQIWDFVFESDLQQAYEDGSISTEEFHERFCQTFGVELELSEVCYAASAIFTFNDEIVPLIEKLVSSGFSLGILSNTCDAHWQYAIEGRYPILNNAFDVYALSFELKCSKPNRMIYEKAAALVEAEPNEIFFVDDRIENVQGAIDCGIDAVQFVDVKQFQTDLASRGIL